MSPRRFAYREIVRCFLRNHIHVLAGAPIDPAETCLYTVAPDEHSSWTSFPAAPT